ncbi:MAG: hypothetical protein P8M25_18930 [Paracoccaceae bacterium]|nr:hypothetical protein [Paracoccaceae bacterium]
MTGVKDRDYFKAIYFKTPDKILFEVATKGPGFDHDEDAYHLGEALKLHYNHADWRHELNNSLKPLECRLPPLPFRWRALKVTRPFTLGYLTG